MRLWPALLALLTALPAAAHSAESGCWDTDPGISVHVDNDLLAGGRHDADYTGGFALHMTPADQTARPLPNRGHAALDRWLHVPQSGCRHHIWQFGLIALTPATLRSDVPVLDDRPFASLLLLGSTAMWNGADERTAWQSSIEIGALGLELAESLHDVMHQLAGDENPKGYQYQVSEGGEPTFRYVLARHRLRSDAIVQGETLQTKSTLALSAGYLTEASASWSLRWGRIESPWQSFTPELTDYLPTPMPIVEQAHQGELFWFAGARVKLRAYNALAQGQARDTVHYLHASELENWLGELWAGVHWQTLPGWAVTYTIRAQTPELRHEPSRRTHVWAGLSISHRF
jgi:hypothetical protein